MGFMDDVLKGIERATKADTPENREWAKYKKDGLVEVIDGTEFVDVGEAVRTKKPAEKRDESHPLSPFHHSFRLDGQRDGADFGCENPSWSSSVPGVTYSEGKS